MKEFMGKDGFVWWHGVVEDINDPLMIGRCRVRVFGFHTQDILTLPTKDLPWAYPMQPITSAAMSGIGTSPTGLLNGSHVMGFFRDGNDAQQPVMLGSFAGIPQDPPKENTGFNDPEMIYPTHHLLGATANTNWIPEEYADAYRRDQTKYNKSTESLIGESDVNRLARGAHFFAPAVPEGVEEAASVNTITFMKQMASSDGVHIANSTRHYGDSNNPPPLATHIKKLVDKDEIADVFDSSRWATSLSENDFRQVGAGQFDVRANYNEAFASINKDQGDDRQARTGTHQNWYVQNHGADNIPISKVNVTYPDIHIPDDWGPEAAAFANLLEHTVALTQSDYVAGEYPGEYSHDVWTEFPSIKSYNPTYPHNHVRQTESGHVIELDDTPGHERIHIYHGPSGTFEEIHPDGSKTTRIKGYNYEIINFDNNVLIRGNCNVHVQGNSTLFIGGDADVEVLGNMTSYVRKNLFANVRENSEIYTKKDYAVHAGGNIIFAAKDNIVLDSESDMHLQSRGDINISSGDSMDGDGKIYLNR